MLMLAALGTQMQGGRPAGTKEAQVEIFIGFKKAMENFPASILETVVKTGNLIHTTLTSGTLVVILMPFLKEEADHQDTATLFKKRIQGGI